jgi:acetoin utilization protein AcuB
MKSVPEIMKYMTTTPHSVGVDQNLQTAEKLMREHKIRHLPVLDGGKVVGILSDRDLKIAQSLMGNDSSKIELKDIVQGEPYAVTPHSKLSEVAATMAENKYGCALVMDNHKLVGVFTMVDALKALATLLDTRLA